MDGPDASVRVLDDGGDRFEVLMFEPPRPAAVVLFAVGAGGDPDRHAPLLRLLAARGCRVAAPRYARLRSVAPGADELATRARRLQLAFDAVAEPHLPGAGVGHSIGAAALLMLAGAEAVTLAGDVVRVAAERRLARLALLAPATDFFAAPGALRGVTAAVVAWAGARDDVTPPRKVLAFEDALRGVAPVEVRIVADAGHFSFMDVPPPHAAEPHPDRDGLLERIAGEVADVIFDPPASHRAVP